MALETQDLIDRRRLKRQLALWRALALLLAVAAVAVGVGRWGGLIERAHVARLDVQGVIVDDADRIQALDEIAEDDDVKALIVHIDSPGGTTVGGESLYHAIRRVAEVKPVVAVIGTLGTSAGYLTAMAADHIVARESSVTGSIGVILQTAEITGLLEKLGIKAEAVKSGPLKASPSPFERMTEEARAATQAVVDDTYGWFVELVAQQRHLAPAEAHVLADGRVYTGRQALANKLIDALGGEREARDWLAAARGVSEDLPVIDVEYGNVEEEWRNLFSKITGKMFLSERVILDGLVSLWHPQS